MKDSFVDMLFFHITANLIHHWLLCPLHIARTASWRLRWSWWSDLATLRTETRFTEDLQCMEQCTGT
ncbi:hypothetical protein AVEN_155808-1, partial [Araneus ventricosus]